ENDSHDGHVPLLELLTRRYERGSLEHRRKQTLPSIPLCTVASRARASARERTRVRPIPQWLPPVREASARKKRSKRRGNASSGIGGPLSQTSSTVPAGLSFDVGRSERGSPDTAGET